MKLHNEHQEVLKKIHLLEEASLGLYKREVQASPEEYLRHVEDFSQFFKTSIAYHFKVEEEALFPVVREAVRSKILLISELLSEHKYILERFSKFERVKQYDESIGILKDVIEMLSSHAKKEEEELLSSLMLTEEQSKIIDKLAGRILH